MAGKVGAFKVFLEKVKIKQVSWKDDYEILRISKPKYRQWQNNSTAHQTVLKIRISSSPTHHKPIVFSAPILLGIMLLERSEKSGFNNLRQNL